MMSFFKLSLFFVVVMFNLSWGVDLCTRSRELMYYGPGTNYVSNEFTFEDTITCPNKPPEWASRTTFSTSGTVDREIRLGGWYDYSYQGDDQTIHIMTSLTKWFERQDGNNNEIELPDRFSAGPCEPDGSFRVCTIQPEPLPSSPNISQVISIVNSDSPGGFPLQMTVSFVIEWDQEEDLVLGFDLMNREGFDKTPMIATYNYGNGLVFFGNTYKWKEEEDTSGILNATFLSLENENELQIQLKGSGGKEVLEYEVKMVIDTNYSIKPDFDDDDDDDDDDSDDSDHSSASELYLMGQMYLFLFGVFAVLALKISLSLFKRKTISLQKHKIK